MARKAVKVEGVDGTKDGEGEGVDGTKGRGGRRGRWSKAW
jgi:hypothetical protein